MRTCDPIDDFSRYDAEQERALDMLPECVCCGDPIQDDYYYDVNGDFFCCDCMNDNFRKSVEDYID